MVGIGGLRLPLYPRFDAILDYLGVLLVENGSEDVHSILRLRSLRQQVLRVTLPDAARLTLVRQTGVCLGARLRADATHVLVSDDFGLPHGAGWLSSGA